MKRREFIAALGGAAAMWPLAARAQQIERVRRIGVLHGLAEDDPEAQVPLVAFRQGLAKLGWLEGQTIRIDYRFARASATRAEALSKGVGGLQP